MGFAVSFALLVTGAVLAIAVDSPNSGANLQTAGLILMLIGLTVLNAVLILREPGRLQCESDDVLHGFGDRR